MSKNYTIAYIKNEILFSPREEVVQLKPNLLIIYSFMCIFNLKVIKEIYEVTLKELFRLGVDILKVL